MKVTGSKRALRLRVRADAPPARVTVNGAPATSTFDAATSSLWILAPAAPSNEVVLAR